MSDARFTVPADHPCLPGHFPGRPVVPGVVLLEAVIAAAGERHGGRVVELTRCKFTHPLAPGVACTMTLTDAGGGRLRFECRGGGRRLAYGSLRLEPDRRG